MPALVQTVTNGRSSWSIDYRQPSKLSARLGRETARIEITDKAAALGIDELVKLLVPKEAAHGA